VIISYNKLWKLLIDQGLNKTQLSKETGISSSTISKLGKNKQISMDSMLKICKVLDCSIGDIVDAIKDDDELSGTEKTEEKNKQE
jgi:DNA-binding Xre family transcriptional regulator